MQCLNELGTIHSVSSGEATSREDAQLKELCEGAVLCHLYKRENSNFKNEGHLITKAITQRPPLAIILGVNAA